MESDSAVQRHHFTLRGSPSGVHYPPLCANCGNPAADVIEYAKVFERTHSDAPTENVVSWARVPFCDDCRGLHNRQATPPSQLNRVLTSFATGDMLGAVLPGIAAVFVAFIALKELVKGRFDAFAIFVGVSAFFALIAWSQRRHVWKATAHFRVTPPTDITTAFDFTDDLAGAFEPPRFSCTVRDARFAAAFEELNRGLEWHRDSLSAAEDRRQSNRTAWIVGSIALALALLGYLLG